MGYINYFCGIVKVLEKPLQTFIKDQSTLTVVRAELPQARGKQVITLHFWGKLASQIKSYYQSNDYVLIEGYVSTQTTVKPQSKSQYLILTVLKVYPLVFKETETLING